LNESPGEKGRSPLKFDIVTIFPGMVQPMLREGIVARAIERGLIDVAVFDLRDFTTDRHRVVDDTPFGGGPGMVLKPEPFFRALARIREMRGEPTAVVMPTPQGRPFSHAEAARLAGMDGASGAEGGTPRQTHTVVLCGRYEGIDERVREALASEELSIGDYVLSGGELAAMVILDACARLVPGVVGDERSVREDSFATALLDHPHYTRPAEFEGRRVPDVLLSGHHGDIERWRRREALRRTLERRPDLLAAAALDAEQQRMLRDLRAEREAEEREHDHERN
jgi:tRNA (guanine37-N1)-methyltransferase